MRMLVTGASTFFAARLIQGLGARGVEVTAADSHCWSVGKASRYASRRLKTPALSRDPGGLLGAIIDELKARPYDLLLPTFEESLLLAEFRDEIEPLTRLLLPPFDVMWQVHHKPSLHRLCLELGLPTPPTVIPANPAALEHQVSGLRFPVVLKLPAANNCLGRVYCNDLPELVARYSASYFRQLECGGAVPFVQQKIDGDPVYTLMFCHAGRKLGEVVYRPLRTYPDREGTSVHRETIAEPQIAAITERLAGATRWTGFLGLDFLVDRADRTPYLIDANPRATPAIQLGCLAGVDWIELLLGVLQNRPVAPRTAKPGVRNRTCLLDIGWLLEGFAPQPRWLPTLGRRIYRFLNPEWPLDSSHDYLGNGEWSCTWALGGQALLAAGRSMLTGRPLGDTILDGASYDVQTVRPMRSLRLEPARVSETQLDEALGQRLPASA